MYLRPDNKPLYLLVIDRIKQDIENEVYRPNKKLPSEFELAKKLGVSRATLREALRILEDENVLTRKHGVGTFVNAKPVFTNGIEELKSITQMIEMNNQQAGTIVLSNKIRPTTENDKTIFNIDEQEKIIIIDRIITADNEPLVYCVDKIPVRYVPKEFHYSDGSLFKTLKDVAKINIRYAYSDIQALNHHEKISSLLQSPSETSLLVLKQSHYDEQQHLVLHSTNYFRADKFRFQVVRKSNASG